MYQQMLRLLASHRRVLCRRITQSGRPVNMWSAPQQLLDADPFHLRMVGEIRAAMGLSPSLPFASATNRTIVLAFADAAARKQ